MEVDFLARLALLDEYDIALELCMEIKEQPSIEGEQVLVIRSRTIG